MPARYTLDRTTWPIVVFSSTTIVLICLIMKMFIVTEVSSALVIAIGAICGLLIISPRIFDLVELTVSKDGLVAKINDAERKAEAAQRGAEDAGRKIDRLFASTMSDSMFANLKKVASGNFGMFENNGGLRRELRHLRDIGYIEVKGHVGDLPDRGPNLSEFVTVTTGGKDFVAFREQQEAKD